MLKINPMVPRGRTLIDIGYKYNVGKVLSFIVTDNTGRKKSGIDYLYKYPDQFYNIAIRPVSRPLFMYNFFGSVNEVDSHKKPKKYDLALEKLWVTQCGWLWLFKKIAMGMTITNLWRLISCGVKRDPH